MVCALSPTILALVSPSPLGTLALLIQWPLHSTSLVSVKINNLIVIFNVIKFHFQVMQEFIVIQLDYILQR